jgi:hypothetical protein
MKSMKILSAYPRAEPVEVDTDEQQGRYPMARSPDSRIFTNRRRLPAPEHSGGHHRRDKPRGADTPIHSPLTVAGPCGPCTHFPWPRGSSRGIPHSSAEYSTRILDT